DSVGANVMANVRDSVMASVWDSVWDSVRDSVRDSVWDSVRNSVRDSVGANVMANVRDSVMASVWDSVWDSVRDSVRDSVWDSVMANVMANVRNSVRDSVRDSVWDSVMANVMANVRDSVRDSVMASVWDSVFGQHEAGWLSSYDFFSEVCGLRKETQKLSGLLALSQSAGWVLPHRHICLASERHCVLERDKQGRLHSVSGPAVAYPDGWAIYALHGVRVPEWIITRPQEITIEKIGAEKNVEIRRVMIERYGEERYIVDSGMKPVAHDERFGTLYVERAESGRPIAKIKVINRTAEPDGTFRSYWLSINPALYDGDAGRIPQAAVASSWRTTPGGEILMFSDWREYAPEIET
ncbi:DUF6745 domain-containing protein, partial [Sphingomonas sp.]|uniref:DUF6745 domain-containing protein n=1 Tax=Sphingomonas sp. TaxID=28214 RepID=UPI0025F8FDE9